MPRPATDGVRRLAFVLGQNDRGGTELQARFLVDALRGRGVKVDVFLVDGSWGAEGLGDSVTVLAAGPRPSSFRAVPSHIRMVLQLRRGLRGHTVVHSAMARGYVLASLALMGRTSARHVSWRRNAGIHLTRASRLNFALERFAARRTDLFVANAEAVVDFWSEIIPNFRQRSVVIPNLLDTERFRPSEARPDTAPGDRVRLVTVGALKHGKGHVDLLHAISDSRLRERVALSVLGDGPLRRDLRLVADRLGVPVTFHGQVNDVAPHLARADVFVLASHSEGLSNAVAEALAMGLCVIATRVGGVPALVGDGGVLVEPADSAALAEAIFQLVIDPARRDRLKSAARRRATQFFDNDAVLDQYLKAYQGSS